MTIQLEKNAFFKKYNIDQTAFQQASINWDVLSSIYEDHLGNIPVLEEASRTIADILREHPDVHTVRSRIKSSEHLLEKIIRKVIRKQETENEYQITLNNYKQEVTDLIGIRVLHLYKDQAFQIDHLIRKTWELDGTPTKYERKGDLRDKKLENDAESFSYKEHPAGYRSWHYIIRTQVKEAKNIAEIQVRTIFEEGWSEIDHQLRYPYELDNELLNNQLLVLNRIAGSADELVSSIRETKINLKALQEDKKEQDKLIEEFKQEIRGLSKNKEIQEGTIKSLEKKVAQLEEAQKKSYMKLSTGSAGLYLSSKDYEWLPNTDLYSLKDSIGSATPKISYSNGTINNQVDKKGE
ncbi:hypothetical protein L2D08_07500 [Domibacillus sp. PGB-M46]|uniref:RelA/SpoT domain-containing protein n=1 Tax=Domibacillus sp. PGB-M46 TaxID=2910255 RepID=UPI001F573FAE|nr:hypothetical protein [Domibacillus sp. PGB-M46]MCI2254207.1 hypothetical protein [Domibacillus sp. PGB-M46]